MPKNNKEENRVLKEDFIENIMRALSSIVYPMLGGVCIGFKELDNEKVSFHVHDVSVQKLNKLSGAEQEESKVFNITFDFKDINYGDKLSVMKAQSTTVNKLQYKLIERLG